MWTRLTRTVAPARVVTFAEVQAQSSAEAADQSLVESLIDVATGLVEGPNGIGVALLTQTWEMRLDCLPARIRIPLGPVQQVSEIAYVVAADGTTDTVDPSLYLVSLDRSPAVIDKAFGAAYPAVRSQSDAATVTFVAGYGATAADVPPPLRQAIIVKAKQLFEMSKRESDVRRENVFGVAAQEFSSAGTSSAEALFEALVAPYRVSAFR